MSRLLQDIPGDNNTESILNRKKKHIHTRAVRRFRVTRNSSNEILDSGKLLDSVLEIRVESHETRNSGFESHETRNSGPKMKKICFFHILLKFVRKLG